MTQTKALTHILPMLKVIACPVQLAGLKSSQIV